jgi:hypothetical protein
MPLTKQLAPLLRCRAATRAINRARLSKDTHSRRQHCVDTLHTRRSIDHLAVEFSGRWSRSSHVEEISHLLHIISLYEGVTIPTDAPLPSNPF